MNKILNTRELTNAICLTLISLLIWFIGPFIKIDNHALLSSSILRIELICTLFILWLIKVLIFFILEKYTTHTLIKNLEQEKAEYSLSPHTLRKNIMYLIQALRHQSGERTHSWFRTKAAPLFIIIGDSSSGKTTLLAKSGVTFFSDTRAQKIATDFKKMNAGNWWLTNEGIFLEINIKTDNITTLSLLLSIFKSNRLNHTFHGVILAQEINQIINLPEDECALHAQTITAFLTAFYNVLKIQVPLYIMITKADQMSGFYEYFDVLSEEERQSSLGYTIQKRDPAVIQEVFKLKHSSFISSLENDCVHTLLKHDLPLSMGRALNFPQQLFVIKNALQLFLKNLFDFKFDENPYPLYGLYFSSATTNPTETKDYYLSSLQKIIKLTNQPSFELLFDVKNYFIKGFINHEIFKGVSFITNKQRQHMIMSSLKRVFVIVSSILLSSYLIFSCFCLVHLRTQTKDMNTLLNNYIHTKSAPHPLHSLKETLPFLDPLHNLIQIKQSYICGYQTYTRSIFENINQKLDSTLLSAITCYLAPVAFQRIEFLLEQEHEPNDNMMLLLQAYSAFDRNITSEQNVIRTILSDDIKATYKNDVKTQDRLLWYVNKTKQSLFPHYHLDMNLVKTKQELLQQSDPVDRIYKRIKAFAELKEPRYLVPANAWDPYFRQIFNEDQTFIPIFYTTTGFDSIFKTKAGDFINEILHSNSTIEAALINNSILSSKDRVRNALNELYRHDYLTHWKTFLTHIKIIPTQTLNDLLKLITLLSGKDEILLKILTFSSDELYPLTSISNDAYFKELVDFAQLTKEKDLLTLQKVMTTLGQLATSLTTLLHAPDVQKACFVYLQNYQKGENHPLRALEVIISTLPSPLQEWLLDIKDRTHNHLIQETSAHIDSVWTTTVYSFYEKSFVQTYPFLEKSSQELELSAFKKIFGAKGSLETFFETCLKPFITDKKAVSTSLENRKAKNLSDYYKAHVRLIENVRSMRDQFFDEKDNLLIPFQVESFTMDSNISALLFSYATGILTYRHGPTQRKKFNWPDTDIDKNTCEISIVDFDQNEEKRQYEGLWGIFKLLDQSTIKPYKGEKSYLLTLPFKKSTQLVLTSPKLVAFLKELRKLHFPKNASLIFNSNP